MDYQNYFKEQIIERNLTKDRLNEITQLFSKNNKSNSEYGLRNFATFTNKDELSIQRQKLTQTHNSDSFKINHRDSNGNPINEVVQAKEQFKNARQTIEATWMEYQESKFKGEDVYTKLLEKTLLKDFSHFQETKSQMIRTESKHRESHVKYQEFKQLEESFKEKNPFTTSNVTFEMNDPAYYEKYLSKEKQDNLKKESQIAILKTLPPLEQQDKLSKINSYSSSVFEVSKKLEEGKKSLFNTVRIPRTTAFNQQPKQRADLKLSTPTTRSNQSQVNNQSIELNRKLLQQKVDRVNLKQPNVSSNSLSKINQLKILITSKIGNIFQNNKEVNQSKDSIKPAMKHKVFS